ncbi:MAG: amidohydrolase family protein [Ilumatobacteraceae bacterium]|nr:amidohydrolase family protein [Ilumatobacteraceae bacterium]
MITEAQDAQAGRERQHHPYHLISADSHVNEPADLWVSRVAAKFRDRVPRVERFEQGDAWVIEGLDGPMPIGLNACAGQDPRLRQNWVRFDEIRTGGWDPAARVQEIEVAGVDAEVLYPTPRLSHAIFATTEPDFHLAQVQAYNDWLHEYASYDLRKFRALPILPNRGVDQALAEIERVGGRPSTGGFVIGAYPSGELTPQPEDDPVFAALEERNITLNIHVSLKNTMPVQKNLLALPAAGRFTGATTHLIDLIFSGVFDRFPALQLVFAEVDCGWLPYFKEQLDDGFSRYRFRFDLAKLPSEYIQEHVHFSWVTDTFGIDNRHHIGVERMLWSSDYPHGSSNYPDAWSPTMAAMAGVPLAERNLMLKGNAQRLYKFPNP